MKFQQVTNFLLCETPESWLLQVPENLPVLLIDHANCEKKAASTAMNLIYKYIDRPELLQKLSRLAREELRHFEQVLSIMTERGIEYAPVSPSRYAGGLRAQVRTHEPARLIDMLIVGAIVEARSCERFGKLIQMLEQDEPELSGFYRSLLKSESRHFMDYLGLAERYEQAEAQKGAKKNQPKIKEPLDQRIALFLLRDRELILSEDHEFRFHSGTPSEMTSPGIAP